MLFFLARPYLLLKKIKKRWPDDRKFPQKITNKSTKTEKKERNIKMSTKYPSEDYHGVNTVAYLRAFKKSAREFLSCLLEAGPQDTQNRPKTKKNETNKKHGRE